MVSNQVRSIRSIGHSTYVVSSGTQLIPFLKLMVAARKCDPFDSWLIPTPILVASTARSLRELLVTRPVSIASAIRSRERPAAKGLLSPLNLFQLVAGRPLNMESTMRFRFARAISACVAIVALGSCSPEQGADPIPPAEPPTDGVAFALGDPVAADRDTYVASADNTSRGSRDSIAVDGTGPNRLLVHIGQSALVASVGGGTVTSAKLEMTIKATNTGWPAGGATVDVYRVLKDWTEAGATWNCAIDSNTGNSTADCSGVTAWSMASGAGAT